MKVFKGTTKALSFNLMFMAPCALIYKYPEYSWYLETILITLILLGILGRIVIIGGVKGIRDDLQDNYIMLRKSKVYIAVDLLVSLAWFAIFIFVGYRFIFVLYIVSVFLNIVSYLEERQAGVNSESNIKA